jgi:CBS domain-containing protein
MALYQNLMQEPVSKLELRELVAVPPTTSIRKSIAAMRRTRVGCVAVVDEAGRPLGVFTERLLLQRLVSDPGSLNEPLGDHMDAPCACVTRDDSITKLIDCMESRKLRFVCVIDEKGRAVALAGQKGVVAFLAEQFPREVKVQEWRSKMHMDQREGA